MSKWPLCITAACLLVLPALSAARSQHSEAEKASLRLDALVVMGAGLVIPGVAAYCDRYVERNPALIAAVAAWNLRHNGLMSKTVHVIEWSGGMTAVERKRLDSLAYRRIKEMMSSEHDARAFCQDTVASVNSRAFDLDNFTASSVAVGRINAASIP